MKRTLISSAAALALTAGLAHAAAHEGGNPMVGGAEMSAEMNIIENALNSPIHTTLVTAVQAAGLVETLQGDGPFTVFAPTDEAFAALPDGTVETLLMPENKDMLTEILTCHVVGADVMSDALAGMISDGGGEAAVDTLGGCTLTASMDGENITITDERGTVATVTIADVDQSNGVIHVIDAVMLPAEEDAAMDDGAMEGDDMASDDGMMNDSDMSDEEMAMADDVPQVGGAPMFPSRNIVENAVNSADHTTLVAAVQAAGLVETLSSEGPFTVFAPVNAAFDALPDGTVETLLMPENKDQLTKVLTAHVVAGSLTAEDIIARERASHDGFYHFTAVSGDALSARVVNGGEVFIFDESGNAYQVTQANVMQSNGIIHVIEGVLLPH